MKRFVFEKEEMEEEKEIIKRHGDPDRRLRAQFERIMQGKVSPLFLMDFIGNLVAQYIRNIELIDEFLEMIKVLTAAAMVDVLKPEGEDRLIFEQARGIVQIYYAILAEKLKALEEEEDED